MTKEHGTDPDKSPGWCWERDFKIFVFWFWRWQIELYFNPVDWSVHYWSDFGLVSLGPIVINWSDDD